MSEQTENQTEMENAVVLEDNVPVAPINRGSTSPYVKALSEMQEGQSFVVPEKKLQTIRANAKKMGVKIITRSVDEENVRVWRDKQEA